MSYCLMSEYILVSFSSIQWFLAVVSCGAIITKPFRFEARLHAFIKKYVLNIKGIRGAFVKNTDKTLGLRSLYVS